MRLSERVEKIEADHRNNVMVRVRWYYRPEESISGRRTFHGAKELLLSDHYDTQSAHSIEGKCTVHSFRKYAKLENVGAEDYFCRFEYMATTGRLTPDLVAVFHPSCVGISIADAKKLDHFLCSFCSSDEEVKTLLNSFPVSPSVDKPISMAKTKPGKKNLNSYSIKGTDKIVQPGDCVMMRSSDSDKPPSVARVEKIEADHRNNVKVRVRWYYRPEESICGRKQFHGAKELFLSDQYDTRSALTIEGQCTVHTFRKYTKLENVSAEDYYCRFEYKAATGGFIPDRVAVYCNCEMPYNPDDLMLKCEGCTDRFHPSCMGISIEDAKKLDHFLCSFCSSDEEVKRLLNSYPVSPSVDKVEPKPRKR